MSLSLYSCLIIFFLIKQDNNVYHGIGTNSEWQKLTRDLIVDLQKGIAFLEKDKAKHKISRSKIRVISIALRGSGNIITFILITVLKCTLLGAIDNLTLSSSEHIQQFYDAAEWFVKHQNPETGGWAIPVKRKLASGFQDLQQGM